MGFFASRIAVTLFLSLWICRTQGQHGGMDNGELLSLTFYDLRFDFSFAAVTDDSAKRFLPQHDARLHVHFMDDFLVDLNAERLLLNCSFHCIQMVPFSPLLSVLAVRMTHTMKALLYS